MSFDDLQGGSFDGRRRITDRPNIKVNITVTKSTSTTLYGSVTLDQLREFIAACKGLNGNAKVKITTYAGDQRDGSSTTITVSDA